MDELNEKPHDQQPTRLLLARALRRARGSLLWERLWPALASVAIVLGLFLAFSWAGPLADIAAARARNRPDHFRPAVDRGGGAAGDPAAAERQRRAAAPRSPQRRNTPAGDGRFRSHCCKRKRSGGAGPLAGACRARAAVRAQDQSRLADAAAVAARSDGVARARVHFGGGDVLRGERRAVQACRRRLRLARRGRAGEFPDRRVDHAAGLYRTAAGDAARPASG